jgi:hypothetical protein
MALPVRSSVGPLSRLDRELRKELEHTRAAQTAAAARHAARVETVGRVTEVALVNASRISTVEATLIGRTPHAEARLRHIADAGVAGMSNLLLDLERSL